ncbi:DNA replication licensing factor MCM2 [Aduncisulcus paluster]|uniref:DNA helicase n=1 Tax=Aduncisulcus paluster TaxID=2918883 RepID=A0ABQ5JWB7_9EUKA|nr:DNA replication licensing factor MCM2 [Aduncisulcus paluster]
MEGEDLFEQLEEDYVRDEAMDRYDEAHLDRGEYAAPTVDQLRAAEQELAERDAEEARGMPSYLSDIVRRKEIQDRSHRRSTGQKLLRLQRQAAKQQEEESEREGETETGEEPFEEAEEEEEEDEFDLSVIPEDLSAFLAIRGVQRTIFRRFRKFLSEFALKDDLLYVEGILNHVLEEQNESISIDYRYVADFDSQIALLAVRDPTVVLPIFDGALKVFLGTHEKNRFKNLLELKPTICVRLYNTPRRLPLRDLRERHLGQLINLRGVISRRSTVFPQLAQVKYLCLKCEAILGPFVTDAVDAGKKPLKEGGLQCQCGSKGPFRLISEETLYRNYQKLTFQESPQDVPAGRIPRSRELVVTGDMIDIARPGDSVEVCAIYTDSAISPKAQYGFHPIFETHLFGVHIKSLISGSHIANDLAKGGTGFGTSEDRERSLILEVSRQPNIVDRIIRSIAPFVHGNDEAKTAIALALFGGARKEVREAKHSLRGDINVLLVGDPSTAKSQLLKFVQQVSPRCILTTGKGASAVGLTASVRRDAGGETSLEGGALVLADRGICCIDEFDKMTERDRSAIHEAMEQQAVSVAKAGIVATLRARCSVIAAANPIGGRYIPHRAFVNNVELEPPLISRFDVICVLRDIHDPFEDSKKGDFVVSSHMKSHPASKQERDLLTSCAKRGKLLDSDEKASIKRAMRLFDPDFRDVDEDSEENSEEEDKETEADSHVRKEEEEEDTEDSDEDTDIKELYGSVDTLHTIRNNPNAPFPIDFLRKYITYAKFVHTQSLTHEFDKEKLNHLFGDLRQVSSTLGVPPPTVRTLESTVRLAEAHARMNLSSSVRDSNLDFGAKVVVSSFISQQRSGSKARLGQLFNKYCRMDVDRSLKLSQLLYTCMKEEVRSNRCFGRELEEVRVPLARFIARCRREDIMGDIERLLKSDPMLLSEGFVIDGDEIVKAL